ncbi:MAG: AAA family ATPase [Acidobacteriia bacterium]|nr:AAA family ATPase [Terriglobia bacterium]
MNEENQGVEDLWNRILAGIASKIPMGCYDTWFRPLEALRLHGSVLDLMVPTEAFRTRFAGKYLDLLHQVATEAAGTSIEVRLSTRQPVPSQGEGCASNGKAQPLPVVRASELEIPVRRQSWLIERLWTHQAVGIIGGSPKSGKTWLALEIAVSVASGSPCLDTFPVFSPGPVLLYAAEDSATALRARVETLTQVHKVNFERLDVHIITVDSLRLDRPDHQDRLEATLNVYRPVLLVLDPLVRVHAIDENVAGQVAALLGYLRALQRATGAAIALVHHVRKSVSPTGAAGYSLRGSGDLYAWLDSFLYLRMHRDQRSLSAEHRSAPAFGPVTLDLVNSDPVGAYLKIRSAHDAPSEPLQDGLASRIRELLSKAPEPMTVDALRSRLQVRNQRVVETLHTLEEQGKIQRNKHGFLISR